MAQLKNKSNPSPRKRRCRLAQAFQHEMIMTRIRLGKTSGQTKPDDQWKIRLIGTPNRVFERMIEMFALRLLHPVENVTTLSHRLVVQQANTFWRDFRSLSHSHFISVRLRLRNATGVLNCQGRNLMILQKFGLPLLWLSAISVAQAANPFLSAADDKPVSAKFRGAEWGDNIAQEEIGLSARVVTTRVAKMSWGEIYKISFTNIASRARQPRKISSQYFIATDSQILLLNEENNEAAIKKIATLEKAPDFEQRDIYGMTEGKLEYTEGPWETTIELKNQWNTPEVAITSV